MNSNDTPLDFGAAVELVSTTDTPSSAPTGEAPPATPEQPKRGRGRPPVNDGRTPEERKRERDRLYRERKRAQGAQPQSDPAQPRAGQQRTLDDELRDLGQQYQQAPPPPPQPGATPGAAAPMANLVSGYVLVLVTDAVLPAVIVFGLRRFAKRDDVSADDLRLTDKEKNALEPIADRAASFILGSLNPVALYLSVAGAMYLTRIPKNPTPKPRKAAKEPAKDPVNK